MQKFWIIIIPFYRPNILNARLVRLPCQWISSISVVQPYSIAYLSISTVTELLVCKFSVISTKCSGILIISTTYILFCQEIYYNQLLIYTIHWVDYVILFFNNLPEIRSVFFSTCTFMNTLRNGSVLFVTKWWMLVIDTFCEALEAIMSSSLKVNIIICNFDLAKSFSLTCTSSLLKKINCVVSTVVSR